MLFGLLILWLLQWLVLGLVLACLALECRVGLWCDRIRLPACGQSVVRVAGSCLVVCAFFCAAGSGVLAACLGVSPPCLPVSLLLCILACLPLPVWFAGVCFSCVQHLSALLLWAVSVFFCCGAFSCWAPWALSFGLGARGLQWALALLQYRSSVCLFALLLGISQILGGLVCSVGLLLCRCFPFLLLHLWLAALWSVLLPVLSSFGLPSLLGFFLMCPGVPFGAASLSCGACCQDSSSILLLSVWPCCCALPFSPSLGLTSLVWGILLGRWLPSWLLLFQ